MVRQRVSAIIVNDKKILLIHRIKNNTEYYVFPGGGKEEGESDNDAVKREVKEETNLDVENIKFAFDDTEILPNGDSNKFYFVAVSDGEPKLIGPELEDFSPSNYYNPEWIELKKIKDLTLFPTTGKNELLKTAQHNS